MIRWFGMGINYTKMSILQKRILNKHVLKHCLTIRNKKQKNKESHLYSNCFKSRQVIHRIRNYSNAICILLGWIYTEFYDIFTDFSTN